jgi:hypothetical protein
VDIGIATEKSINRYNDKIRSQLLRETDILRNESSISASCSLPSLDPFHTSVSSLIKKLAPLDCGTLHSSFQNNIVSVKGEDIAAVKFQIVSRPKLNDFDSKLSDPVVMQNYKKQNYASKMYSIKPGK